MLHLSPIQNQALETLLSQLPQSFRRGMLAQNRAPLTVRSYMDALSVFYAFLLDRGMPLAIGSIRREHIETWLISLQTEPNMRTGRPVAASTLYKYYKVARVYFAWALDEGEIKVHPMAKMKAPEVPEQPPPVLTRETVTKLLKVCEGRDFYARRDMAIFRVLLDTGIRLSELAGLAMDSIDWEYQTLTVMGKGRRERTVPFGHRTAQALDRYKRSRSSYPTARLPELWLGHAGMPLTPSGIQQMMQDRGERAGMPDLHPHLFRHNWAQAWLGAGGTEISLMRLAGWRSRLMVSKYSAGAEAKLARDEHQRLRIAEDI